MKRDIDSVDADEAARLLNWLISMGADEIVGDTQVNRFSVKPNIAGVKLEEGRSMASPSQAAPSSRPSKPSVTAKPTVSQALGATPASVAACNSIEELIALLNQFDEHPLKRTASSLSFAGGVWTADVMVIGDVAGRDEDISAEVFAGASFQLLSNMLQAIGLSPAADKSARAVSLFNLVPWRPPGNRPPTEQEVAPLKPFIERAIQLLQPKLLLCFGGLTAQALLNRSDSLMTLRGRWFEYELGGRSIPLISTFAPRWLLQQRAQKRLAWRDLLSVQAKLQELR